MALHKLHKAVHRKLTIHNHNFVTNFHPIRKRLYTCLLSPSYRMMSAPCTGRSLVCFCTNCHNKSRCISVRTYQYTVF